MGGSGSSLRSSWIEDIVKNNEVSEETVLGSKLMEKMVSELSTDPTNPFCCSMTRGKQFLKALFKELHVSVPPQQLNEILKKCQTTDSASFNIEVFKNLAIQTLPQDAERLTNSVLMKIPETFEFFDDPEEQAIYDYISAKGICGTSYLDSMILEDLFNKFVLPDAEKHVWTRNTAQKALKWLFHASDTQISDDKIVEITEIAGETFSLAALRHAMKNYRKYFITLDIHLSTQFERTPEPVHCVIASGWDNYTVTCNGEGSAWLLCGNDLVRQIPVENICSVASSSKYSFWLLTTAGEVYQYAKLQANEQFELKEMEKLERIISISSTDEIPFFVSDEGSVFYYPSFRDTEELEQAEVADKVISVHCGPKMIMLLGQNGSVWAAALNVDMFNIKRGHNSLRFTKLIQESNIKTISCGQKHVLFLLDDGSVYSCGNGECGELGLGGNAREVEFPKKIETLQDIVEIFASSGESFFVGGCGTLWGSGYQIFIPQKKDLPPISVVSSYARNSYCILVVDEEGSLWDPNNCKQIKIDSQATICSRRFKSSKSARK